MEDSRDTRPRTGRKKAAQPEPVAPAEQAAETPAPAGYHLTPAAEDQVRRIAAALLLRPETLVEVAVREWCAAWRP